MAPAALELHLADISLMERKDPSSAARADVAYKAAEAKNIENKSILKLASWFDWWLSAVRTLLIPIHQKTQ